MAGAKLGFSRPRGGRGPVPRPVVFFFWDGEGDGEGDGRELPPPGLLFARLCCEAAPGLAFSIKPPSICVFFKNNRAFGLSANIASRPGRPAVTLPGTSVTSFLRPCLGMGTGLGPALREQDGIPGDVCAVWDTRIYRVTEPWRGLGGKGR